MKTKLSFQVQLQQDPGRDLHFIQQVQPRWIKLHQPDPNRTRELLEVVEKVVLRFFDISEQHMGLASDPLGLGYAHGEFAGNRLRREWGLSDEQLARIAMEGLNEPPVENPAQASRVNMYGIAFAEAAAQHGVQVATPCLATGWPYNHGHGTPPDYEPFRGLVESLRRTGSYWASHEYWDARGLDSEDWLWNPGRILQRPAWMRGRGFRALITECGYDAKLNASPGTPHHGWNGHLPAREYAADHLGVYDTRMQADPDIEALMVFLLDTDNPGAWWTFDVAPCRQEILEHVAWMRNQPEPEPPEEDKVHLPIVVRDELFSANGPESEPEPASLTADLLHRFASDTGLVALLAGVLGIRTEQLQAILAVESGGRAFGEQGRMVIRFEAHVFWDEWGKHHPEAFDQFFRFNRQGKRWLGHYFHKDGDWQPIHTGRQETEWAALELASSLDRKSALRSTSAGMGQIMGFNHKRVGYETVEEMFRSYEISATNQLMGVVLFVVVNDLVEALRKEDYLAFARVYNGPSNAEEYARRIRRILSAA